MADSSDIIELKVDVGVLKTQITLLTKLCEKMDTVIEKLIDNHDRHIAKVYNDMDAQQKETDRDIRETHERIDGVVEKIGESEQRMMEEIKTLRNFVLNHNREEREIVGKVLKWKWMLIGGIIAITWLTTHLGPDTILKMIE